MTATKKKILMISGVTLISLALTIVIISQFAPIQMLHGDYPYYPDVKSITNAADVIIVGEVISARDVNHLMVDKTPNKANKETTPYTLSKIKVTEVIKGNVNIGDVITIKQLGDYKKMPEATLYEMDGYLKSNTEQLMFLCEYDDSPYSPVNPAQGIVEVKNGYLFSNNKYSLFGYSSNKQSTQLSSTSDTLTSAIELIKSFVQ